MGFSDGSLGILNIETGKILFARFSTSLPPSPPSSSSSSSLISCVWKSYNDPHENDNYNNHEQSIDSSNSINYNYNAISDSGGVTCDGSSSSSSSSSSSNSRRRSSSSSSRWTSDVWLRDGLQQIQRGGMIPYNDPISSVSPNNSNAINGINSISSSSGSSSSRSGNMSGSVVNGIGIGGGNILNLSSSSGTNDNHTLYECSNLLHLSLSSNGHVYGHIMGLFPLFHIQLLNHNQQHIYQYHYYHHDNHDDFHSKIEFNDNNDDGSSSSKTATMNKTKTNIARSNNTISTTSTTFNKIDACIVLNKLIVTSCYHDDHNGDEHANDGSYQEGYIYSIITLSNDVMVKTKGDDLSDSSSSSSNISSSSNVLIMNDNDDNHNDDNNNNKLSMNIAYNEIYWLQQLSILQSIINYNINLISDYILLCHKKWKECCKVILPKLSLLQNLLNTYEIHCTSIEFLYMITLCGNNWHPCISIIFNQHWNEQSILRLNHNIELSSRSIIKMIHMKIIPLAMNTLLASR
jgi:hypothetical protein